MSYNHQSRSQGYVPSYTSSRNTGAAYMERRGWNSDNDQATTISFSSKSSTKRIYITLFVLLALLLLAAIIIIILFATGVFSREDPLRNPTSPPYYPTIRPDVFPTIVPPGPPIFQQNATYSGSLNILQQASDVYDMKNTNTYFSAFNLIQSALDNIFVSSTLQPYAAKATLTDLQNRGNDLNVLFRVTMLSANGVDQNTIVNVIRSNLGRFQGQLGGNAQVDQNSIFVFRLFVKR